MRVLIFDDRPTVVSSCRAILESDPSLGVFEASDGKAGYSAFFAPTPDIAIIDLNLPRLSGRELVRRSPRRKPQAKNIIFSRTTIPLLPAAVKSVPEGGVYLHPELTRQIAFLRTGAKASKMSNLSPREFEILRLIAAGRTVAEIADQLDVSYRTIANNSIQLKNKLGTRSSMDLMRIAFDLWT
jgi:two-component system, NarL family, invasion response regulator UvrY